VRPEGNRTARLVLDTVGPEVGFPLFAMLQPVVSLIFFACLGMLSVIGGSLSLASRRLLPFLGTHDAVAVGRVSVSTMPQVECASRGSCLALHQRGSAVIAAIHETVHYPPRTAVPPIDLSRRSALTTLRGMPATCSGSSVTIRPHVRMGPQCAEMKRHASTSARAGYLRLSL